MRRAKKPPSPELVAECGVFADMIAVGRREEIRYSDELGTAWTHSHPAQGALLLDSTAIIRILTEIAMSEYLRRYPKTRKMNAEPWHEDLLKDGSGDTGERDYQCFFCRKSLNTMPSHRMPSGASDFIATIREHCEECGIRMLAGLMKPRPPLKRGEPGR